MGVFKWLTGFGTAVLAQIQYFAIVLAIGMGVGAWGTYWLMNTIAKAALVDKVNKVQEQTKENAKGMYKAEQILTAKKDTNAEVAQKSNKEIAKYVPPTVARKRTANPVVSVPHVNVAGGVRSPPPNETWCDCSDGSPSLSLAAVWVLNAQRDGRDPPAPAWLDAEAETPTEIGLRELSEADIALSKYAHDLAAEHNALIDYVENLLAQQRGEKLPHPIK